MILDRNYWSKRYADNTAAWDLGAVSPPLKAYIDQLKNKSLSILIPGAGNAYEAEYLAANDFQNVFVCDFAQAPLDDLKKRCPKIKAANLICDDFFKIKDLQMDLILEQTFFCALNPSLRKDYFKQMAALLKPAGKLAGVLFNTDFNSAQPPFGGSKEEYVLLASEYFKIIVMDECYNSVKPRAGRELFIILEKKG